MDRVDSFLAAMFVSAAVIMIVLAIVSPEKSLRQEAIEHGYAQYSPTTGQWEWKATTDTKGTGDE
jgi:hypothetical protein